MKKALLLTILCLATMSYAQDNKTPIPQISVSGEGKIKVKPDQVSINFGVENFGKDANEVKKLNDETVDKVMKFIKKFGIPTTDFQTTNVSLFRNYDYDKKKYNYQASQSVTILLKDVTQYDELMIGLVDNGINNISNIEFKSSKIEEYKSQARIAAMKDAKRKADDYVSILTEKVGKVLSITDNSAQHYYPQPLLFKSANADASAEGMSQETIAAGEIEVIATVSVIFMLQ